MKRAGICAWPENEPLPVVPFELCGFLMIVGFLLDVQHRTEEITRRYVEGMGRR